MEMSLLFKGPINVIIPVRPYLNFFLIYKYRRFNVNQKKPTMIRRKVPTIASNDPIADSPEPGPIYANTPGE